MGRSTITPLSGLVILASIELYARALGSWDYYMRGRRHEVWDMATTTKKFEADPSKVVALPDHKVG